MSIKFSSKICSRGVWSNVSGMVLRSKICFGGDKGLKSVDWFISGYVCSGDWVGVVDENVECAGLNEFVGDWVRQQL